MEVNRTRSFYYPYLSVFTLVFSLILVMMTLAGVEMSYIAFGMSSIKSV